MSLTFERANDLLEYASDTGVLRWRDDTPESAYDAYRRAATNYFGEEYFADLRS